MKSLLDCLAPEEESTDRYTIGNEEVVRITKKRSYITYPKIPMIFWNPSLERLRVIRSALKLLIMLMIDSVLIFVLRS